MSVLPQGESKPILYGFNRGAITPGRLVIGAGLLAILVPSIITMARLSWSTGSGAHGPIVLATGLWLIWHERHLAVGGKPAALFPTVLLLLAALPVYYVGHVALILAFEGIGCFTICIAVAAFYLGWRTVARFWFPIVYLLFILSPPENWVFVATRPLKVFLSDSAVGLMSWLGYDIAGSASMIMINGYQLQVAAACSGVNSLIGITAIGTFYIYLRHGSQPRYAALMFLLLIPVAVLTNFIRIILLILITGVSGEGVAFDVAHELGGVVIFGMALVILMVMDEALFPFFRRWTQPGTARRVQ